MYLEWIKKMDDIQLIYEAYEAGTRTRATEIKTVEELSNIIYNKCRNNFMTCFEEGNWIYRGTNTPYNFSIMDPSQFHRVPLQNEKAKHNWVLSNLRGWRGIPDRSRSIVGATNISGTAGYGSHVVICIPYDNTEIVKCKRGDLFDSFPKLENEFHGFNISILINTLDNVIKHYAPNFPLYSENLTFDKWCGIINDLIKNDIWKEVTNPDPMGFINDLYPFLNFAKFRDIKDILEDELDFRDNEFILSKDMHKILDDGSAKEIWWSGPTILIKRHTTAYDADFSTLKDTIYKNITE